MDGGGDSRKRRRAQIRRTQTRQDYWPYRRKTCAHGLCGLRSYFEYLRQGSAWHGRLGAFAIYSSRGSLRYTFRCNDEVVQLYVKHLHSAVEQQREELEGYQRVTVDPGQTKTVEIPLPASRVAYWDVNTKAFRVEAEPVELLVGDLSANLPVTTTIEVK
jgi:hypothetical protein